MQHVFEEPSGWRWRKVRVALGCGLTGLLVLVLALTVAAAAPPQLDSSVPGNLLTRDDVGDRIPVVGRGPLERILRVDRSGDRPVGIDPYAETVRMPLTDEEAGEVGDSDYVLQRFGYAAGTTKTIALTFDDGPDGGVTPQLLDLLSRENVPATFFMVGSGVARNPEIVVRMSREGHALGLHTLTHPKLATSPNWREHAELVLAERQVRALTGRGAAIWRMPYSSSDPEDEQETVTGLLRAQRLGYHQVGYDFDSRDWRYARFADSDPAGMPLPDLEWGQSHTVLLHDGGGPNRERSLAYTERLIQEAKRNGYTFVTVPQLHPQVAAANAPVVTGLADTYTHALMLSLFLGPDGLMIGLFWVAIALMVVTLLLHTGLALWRRRARRRRRRSWGLTDRIPVTVSVILAAYNEEPVIERTLHSILASRFRFDEILVVDDGSTDETAERVRRVARVDPRVVLLQQANSGKATALNRAIAAARGEILVTFDADTMITPSTIGHLVEHFERDLERTLGAVAGVVRVGNRGTNLLTRWQALEYVSQIGLERSAQDALGAISIIPGACAAWRRTAIAQCGGFASDTLAEDCDLALQLHRHGWRITQDDRARAFTEAPATLDDLLRQRERWAYGTLQAMVKHRALLGNPRFGALGLYVVPNYFFTLLMPLLFLPFVTVAATLLVIRQGPEVPLLFFGLFMVIQMIQCTVSVALMGDSPRHLVMVPLYRLINDPLRAYLIYLSVFRALRGRAQGWNKLIRTGDMDAVPAPPVPVGAPNSEVFGDLVPARRVVA